MIKLHPHKIAIGSIASVANLCTVLDIDPTELECALALPDSERYTRKTTPKKDGSDRVIFNPHYLIRKIQRRINRRIFATNEVISWPDHIFGSIPNQLDEDIVVGKDYISCARKHCGAKSILTIDIKNFFDNIHQHYVFDIFKNFLKYDETVARVLSNICCMDSHVVQGALTSSYIASLCLYDVEGAVVEKLSRKGLVYTRLVDDINVSSCISDYDFDFSKTLIEDMLAEKGLPTNREKTLIQYVSTVPLTVHGLRVSFKEPRLPSDEVRRIRAAVKNIETLSSERDYRTTHPYRKDFNRCMGRVNKLRRIGHLQHSSLLQRLRKILPLPSKKDIERASKMIEKLENDYGSRRDSYWYWRRFYLAHERLTIITRTFPKIASEFRGRLKKLKPEYA